MQNDNDYHAIHERSEADVNRAHDKRLQIALWMVRCIIYEVAARTQTPSQLDTLKDFLNANLEIVPQRMLKRDQYWVRADHSLLFRRTPREYLSLMPFEDKASPGMGSTINIDGELAGGNTPDSTRKAIYQAHFLFNHDYIPQITDLSYQVFTQVALSEGSLGLLTALKNGTWVYTITKTEKTDSQERQRCVILTI